MRFGLDTAILCLVSYDDREFELQMTLLGVKRAQKPKERRAKNIPVVDKEQQEREALAADAEFEAAMAALDTVAVPEPEVSPHADPDSNQQPFVPLPEVDLHADAEFEAAISQLETVSSKASDASPEPVLPTKPVWETLPRRRSVHLEDMLDLHGATTAEAIVLLQKFVRNAHQSRMRRVGVIVGKGTHSPQQVSILRPEVESWLFSLGAAYIVSVAEAPRSQGGSGVLVVTLKMGSRQE